MKKQLKQAECIMDLPDDKCQMKIELKKERKKSEALKKIAWKKWATKKTNIGTKIKLDGKLYRVDRWCYFTDHSTKYSK